MSENRCNSLVMSTDTKTENNRFALVLIIGTIVALREKAITLEEAEQFLFSPYTAIQLKNAKVPRKTIDLIWHGGELEDVLSIIPDKIDSSIDDILQNALKYLERLPRAEYPIKKWIEPLSAIKPD